MPYYQQQGVFSTSLLPRRWRSASLLLWCLFCSIGTTTMAAKSATATFNMKGVTGTISFSQVYTHTRGTTERVIEVVLVRNGDDGWLGLVIAIRLVPVTQLLPPCISLAQYHQPRDYHRLPFRLTQPSQYLQNTPVPCASWLWRRLCGRHL